MSYSTQQYNQNNDAVVNSQQLDGAVFNGNNDSDIFRSFTGLANQLMGNMLRNSFNGASVSSFASSGSNNPNVQVYGVTSMNVTQISRGPDGRPHVVQAHDERRMGPGGVWQTKKALRDSDRGVDKMQVGYFIGDQGEIVERHRDPNSGQYRQEIKRRGITSNQPNFSNQWRTNAQQVMQRIPPLPASNNQQALPATSQYNQYSQQTPTYEQYSQQAPTYEQYSQQTPTYEQYPQQQSLQYNQY